MKQILAGLLALTLTISLAACGGSDAPTSSASTASSSAPVSSTAPAESTPPSESEAASEAASDETPVRIAALKGPTSIGLIQLVDEMNKGEHPNYSFTMAGAPDELVGKIVQGEIDIAAVPSNLAATLYNKTKGNVQMGAITTLGILYLVERGESIRSVSDLAGKTIYSTGKGSVPEFALNYILAQNGLTDSVKVEYKAEHTELANLMAAGEVDLAVLPQPFVTTVTMQNPEIQVRLDLTEEWEKASKGESALAMTGVIVQKKFIEEHPEAVKAFMAQYADSVAYVTDPQNLDAAAELVVAEGIIPKVEVAKQAIPKCSIVFVDGEQMKEMAEGFFQVLFDANPQSVGGTLPDETIYYLG